MPPRSAVLADTYPGAVALALIGLCPFIVLSTATTLLQQPTLKTLHTTVGGLQMSSALANAGYAFGAVLAAGLISRFRLRVLYPVCELVFVAGSLLCAFATSLVPFLVGHVLQGVMTGLLLVIALPPLLTRFPGGTVPKSAAIVNVGLFGAATAGPLVGGLVATNHAGQALELSFAALGLCGVVLALFAISDDLGRIRTEMPVLQLPVVLALVATVLPFVGSALLPKITFTSPIFLGLVVTGIVALVTLVIRQYRQGDEAMMPMKLLSTTFPVVGMSAAMVAGAGFVALDELAETMLLSGRHLSAIHAGLLFAPQIAGVIVAAAAGVLLELVPRHGTAGLGIVFTASALLGFGAGAAVSPGLFLAGLAAPARQVGPAFALVELLRSEAAYIVAPVVLDIGLGGAKAAPGALAGGLGNLGWAIVAMLVISVLLLVGLFKASGARLHPPDLSRWVDEGERALTSPRLAEPLRESA